MVVKFLHLLLISFKTVFTKKGYISEGVQSKCHVPDSFSCSTSWITRVRRGNRADQPLQDRLRMVIGLELVDDIVHRLNPKAVLARDSLHFFNEIIVQDGTFNLLAVGKQGKSGNGNECNSMSACSQSVSFTKSDWRAISGRNAAGIRLKSRMALQEPISSLSMLKKAGELLSLVHSCR